MFIMIIMCEIILIVLGGWVAWLGLGMRNVCVCVCVCTLRRMWDSLCGNPLVPEHAVPN